MNESKPAIGLSVDDFLEREAGGAHHCAVVLAELGSAVYSARAEWEYHDSAEARELVRLCAALEGYLTELSIAADGTVTRWRECARCSGDGKAAGENPCIECAGVGAVHAEEADG